MGRTIEIVTCCRSVEFEVVRWDDGSRSFDFRESREVEIGAETSACKACVAPRTPWPQNGSSAIGVYQRMSNELEFEFGRCRTKTV
jgi:hypothetical protein